MKRFIYLCLAIGMIAAQQPAVAQATQTIAKPLKLTSVPLGTGAEKILVRDTAGMVRQVDKTTLTPAPTTPTLQQVLQAGNSVAEATSDGRFSWQNKIDKNGIFIEFKGANGRMVRTSNYSAGGLEFGYSSPTFSKKLLLMPSYDPDNSPAYSNVYIPTTNGLLLAIGQENTIPTVAGGVSYVMEGEIPYVLIKTPTRIIKIKAEITQGE